MNWGIEMDFLKEKIRNRMLERVDEVEELMRSYQESAYNMKKL
jgi:hypothetical protein